MVQCWEIVCEAMDTTLNQHWLNVSYIFALNGLNLLLYIFTHYKPRIDVAILDIHPLGLDNINFILIYNISIVVVNPFIAGTVFIRQNLTSVDVRF